MRGVWLIGLALAALTLVRGDEVSADPPVVGYPDSVAVLGDSISQVANSDGFGDQPENSWATGTNPAVNSVYSRLLAIHPPVAGNRFNDSVSGAKMVNLPGQAANAVSQGGEQVMILIGANDVCTPTEASMTPVATFQTQFEAAMGVLSSGSPDARISVGSIPDVHNLWSILHNNPSAQVVWNFASICQSLLANPASTAPADVQRRANVRQRNLDFNVVLANVCATYIHCRYDNDGGFNAAFTPSQVSTIDYFHPSVAGEALAASVAWEAAPDFTDVTPPVSASSGAIAGPNMLVTLSATDAAGVSGVEYKTGTGAWTRYGPPLTLTPGVEITWRAVDTNGNTEGTQTCVVPSWSWSGEDSDCDGFPDTVTAGARGRENFIGTDSADRCADTTTFNDETAPGESPWPPDFNDNRAANLSDVVMFGASFNQIGPNPPNPLYNARFDLNASNSVNLSDVVAIGPFFNRFCTP